MPGGYIPTQSLVFLVTNAEGHIQYAGLDVSPETIYATFLGNAGIRYVFEHRATDGLNVRLDQELTDKIREESRNPRKEVEIRGRGLVPKHGFLLGGVPIYQDIETGQFGGVFWTPEESLKVLDREGLQYKVLKTVEGHEATAWQPTKEEVKARMRERIAKSQ